MPVELHFALNHIVAPRRDIDGLIALAQMTGLHDIELRNDLPGIGVPHGSAASALRRQAEAAGIGILSVNALQRFEQWDSERRDQACALADAAWACGASAILLCPTNDRGDARSNAERSRDLRYALEALLPILSERHLSGLVEPLGFAQCALRLKRCAVQAIHSVGGDGVFRLVHDTFHHYLAGETELFAGQTGLVHISGVDDHARAVEQLDDADRGLVTPDDRMGNVAQIVALRDGGYRGAFSFEPFAPAVHDRADIADALRESIASVTAAVATAGRQAA